MSHILLVEDYWPHAQLISLDLSEAGYRVSTYRTGESALDAMPSLAPDLVVLDRRLPGMDGVQVCQRLRESGYTRPVLFVTAMSEDVDACAGLAAGANAYLIKPFAPRELLDAIAHHLQLSPGSKAKSSLDLVNR